MALASPRIVGPSQDFERLRSSEEAIQHVAHDEPIAGSAGTPTRLQIIPLSRMLFSRVVVVVLGSPNPRNFPRIFCPSRKWHVKT